MKVVIVLPATLTPFEMQLFKPVSRFSYHHLLAPGHSAARNNLNGETNTF